ncbi:MAG: hypothetical protein JEZ00_10150 [Anaerolineaceae bacterium]|nr:hypothetical protein [Anaerolineaceae bacterium]
MVRKKSQLVHKLTQKIICSTFSGWHGILLLIVISALTYLPHVADFNFYRDDWYYIVDGFSGGKGIFHTMFAIDRPARGYLFEWLFRWFGTHPLPYHVSTYIWRLLSGVAALALFRFLWPEQKQATFWMALLFTIYPGYQWWISGVEYQPMIISVCFQVLSILFMLHAIKANEYWKKFVFASISILSGWIYIFFVDYAAGMEALRFFCVYLFLIHEEGKRPFFKQIFMVLRKAWVYLLIPVGYLFWNLFLFQNQRPETNIVGHFHNLFSHPFSTGANWFIHFVRSLLNTAIFSWIVPFYEHFFSLPLRQMAFGIIIVAMVLFSILLFSLLIGKKEAEIGRPSIMALDQISWQKEAFWFGLLGVIFGVLPIIIANRVVLFSAYSHYTLPASLAASMMIIGLVSLVKEPVFRYGIVTSIIVFSVLAHFSIAEKALVEEQKVQEFWWQMTWRANTMDDGTTILAQFPGFHQGEEKDIVWGPANLIFAPGYDHSQPVKYPITAVPINYVTTKEIMIGGGDIWDFRSHSGHLDYGKLLVLSQPTTSSCVHAMDARWPRLTRSDNDQILILSYYSNINTLLLDGEKAQPIDYIFGEEPVHEWCYYYQKAEMALQVENWDEVLAIADEAAVLDFRPNDRSEWMPFLQAAAFVGDEDLVRGYASIINEDQFLRRNACFTLRAMDGDSYALQPNIRELGEELYCHGY